MNWEAIGAIGEIIGAIAVVGSLVYLASQIHASNLAAKHATMQELMHESTNFMGRINTNRESANIWANGLESIDKLDKEDLIRFITFCMEVTIVWERAFYLFKSTNVEPHLIHNIEQNRNFIASSPGYKHWFQKRKYMFSEEFVALIEQEMDPDVEFVPFIEKFASHSDE